MRWLVTLFEPVANLVAEYDRRQMPLAESTNLPIDIPSTKE